MQPIRDADNETNDGPRCQTGGKLLSDHALARLLKSDWPKTLDELNDTAAVASNPWSQRFMAHVPFRPPKPRVAT